MPRGGLPNTTGRTPKITVASSTAANQSRYDYICDGVADDVQIQAALDSLPAIGGMVELSEGIFYGNKASALISITGAVAKPSRHLIGQGIGATEIRQSGAGNVLDFLDASETFGYRIADLSISGQNTAAHGIIIQNGKDCTIERVNISGCLGDLINFKGLYSLHNWILACRLHPASSPSSASLWVAFQNAALLKTRGNSYRAFGNYFGASSSTAQRTISGASNASPIEITTTIAHGLTTGMRAAIVDVTGNTAANGDWKIISTGDTTFTLTGTTGNGAYTGGPGTVHVRRAVHWIQGYLLNDIDDPDDPGGPAGTLTGTAGAIGSGNIYEGCSFGMRSRGGSFTGDWFSMQGNSTFSIARSKAAIWPGPGGYNQISLVSSTIARDDEALYNGEGDVVDGRAIVSINDNLHGSGNGGVLYGAPITPIALTASVTAYDPPVDSVGVTGRHALIWRLSADALGPWTISGIAGGVEGRHLTVINVEANTFNLGNGQADSNGIITGTGADIVLAQNASRTLVYDATSDRWRVIS